MKKRKLTAQQLKSQDVKNRIYQAAVKLLRDYEYEYLTIRNICEEADVSAGTFYHHFENKDDLLSYYIEYGYKEFYANNHIQYSDNVLENIVMIYDVYLSFCLQYGIEFLSNYYSTKNKGVYLRNIRSEEELAKKPGLLEAIRIIDLGKQNGYIKEEVSAIEVGNDIGVIMKGIIFDWCLGDGSFDLRSEGIRLIKLYLHSLLTQKYFDEFKYYIERTKVFL